MTKDEGNVTAGAIEIGGGRLWVELEDGRVIGTPLGWYMPLANATPEQLSNYELLDDVIHWPELDEDLSVPAMLAGVRPRYPWSAEEWRARVESIHALTKRYGSDATILLPINMTDPLDASVTVREIADDYGLSTDAVYQAIRRERLPAQRSGATWLIRRRDAEALWGSARSGVSREGRDAPTHQREARSLREWSEIAARRDEFLHASFSKSTFPITRAAIRGEEFHISIRRNPDITLRLGDALLAVDIREWVPKGVFKVSEERQTEFDAVAFRDVDPLWKGYVHQEKEMSGGDLTWLRCLLQGAGI
jgi:excisionase family DNA binding protein